MFAVLLALLCWTQTPSSPSAPPKLVNEQGAKASVKDGVLELRGGSGWVRTSRPLLDFVVKFEIRALTPDADPGLVVRTWRGWELWPDVGYRLTILPKTPPDVSRLLAGRRQKVEVVQQGMVDLRPTGEWQTVEVSAHGSRIRLAVNDTVAAEFAVESHGGYLMFDNPKGRVELRNITIRASELNEAIPTDIARVKQIKTSGGKDPEIVHEVKPKYTPEAMQEIVQGIVAMEAVVFVDGSVGPVRVTRNLHPDLDVSAVAAVKAWRFRPATLNGSALPSVVEVEMHFTLR
jgi:TonB family protein